MIETPDAGWRCPNCGLQTGGGPQPGLTKLAKQYKTDKWGNHKYTPHYAKHFRPWRHRVINVLEIGIGGYSRDGAGGNSLRMWKDFFPNAQIFGLDIEDKTFVDEARIATFQGDQSDPGILGEIVETAGTLHLIIDDGSHRPADIINTFNILFPLLTHDGIYVIEDTQTSYWPEWGGQEDPGAQDTTMGFVKRLIDGLNHEEFVVEPYEPTYSDLHITSVTCYHNLVFIQKGLNQEGTRKRALLKQRYPDG